MGCKYSRFRVPSKREKCPPRVQTAAGKRQTREMSRHVILPVVRAKKYAVLNLSYIDQPLHWKTHVNFIAAKISKSLGLLYKAKYYLPSKSLLTLYYALIYPYFTYCNLIWASTYVTNPQRTSFCKWKNS